MASWVWTISSLLRCHKFIGFCVPLQRPHIWLMTIPWYLHHKYILEREWKTNKIKCKIGKTSTAQLSFARIIHVTKCCLDYCTHLIHTREINCTEENIGKNAQKRKATATTVPTIHGDYVKPYMHPILLRFFVFVTCPTKLHFFSFEIITDFFSVPYLKEFFLFGDVNDWNKTCFKTRNAWKKNLWTRTWAIVFLSCTFIFLWWIMYLIAQFVQNF